MVLSGSEVKSVRNSHISLKGAYVVLRTKKNEQHELFLINAHISPYKMAIKSGKKQDPLRSRKLLLNKREINSILGKIQQKGLTMVPMKIYTKGSRIKLEFAIASGKKKYDKRQTLKKRELDKKIRYKMMKRG